MNTKSVNSVSVSFTLPKDPYYPLIVNCYLPNGTVEPIGRIYQDFSQGEEPRYISVDNKGEELFPPTTDWIQAEIRFEKYAKEVAEKSLAEAREKAYMEIADREEALNKLRNKKYHQAQELLINF